MSFIVPIVAKIAINALLMIAVFVVAGVMAGVVGYLMNNASVKWRRNELGKSLVFGVLISGFIIMVLGSVYAELFAEDNEPMLNLVLAGCICFMFSMVTLIFAYQFLMKITSTKKNLQLNVGHDENA
ncbi:MAG: hypothetical protein EOO20_27960 [Chryseobacterium sp.]|nr:MAG: hypothetical protein EOO20_27960 [Chryseobacterium sp.]